MVSTPFYSYSIAKNSRKVKFSRMSKFSIQQFQIFIYRNRPCGRCAKIKRDVLLKATSMAHDINITTFGYTSIHPRISIEALPYAFLNTEPPQIQDVFNYIGGQKLIAHHYTFSFHRWSFPAAKQAAMTKPRIHPTEAQTKYHILFLSFLSPIVDNRGKFSNWKFKNIILFIVYKNHFVSPHKCPIINCQLNKRRHRTQCSHN